jgi:hypothetical protein
MNKTNLTKIVGLSIILVCSHFFVFYFTSLWARENVEVELEAWKQLEKYNKILSEFETRIDQTMSQVVKVLNISGTYEVRTPFLQIFTATVYFDVLATDDFATQWVNRSDGTIHGGKIFILDDLLRTANLASPSSFCWPVDRNSTIWHMTFETVYWYGTEV